MHKHLYKQIELETTTYNDEQYSIISNNCTGCRIFNSLNQEYNNPFIGSLIPNDNEHVKFCNNFKHYINCAPHFGKPKKNGMWALQNNSPWFTHKIVDVPYCA
jgi:uncharacterized protein (DUF1919 family)